MGSLYLVCSAEIQLEQPRAQPGHLYGAGSHPCAQPLSLFYVAQRMYPYSIGQDLQQISCNLISEERGLVRLTHV